jgi:hypothetical protein
MGLLKKVVISIVLLAALISPISASGDMSGGESSGAPSGPTPDYSGIQQGAWLEGANAFLQDPVLGGTFSQNQPNYGRTSNGVLVIGQSGSYSQPTSSQPEGFAAAFADALARLDAAISKLQLLQNSISQDMEAAKNKGDWERWKSLQDTQTKIYEIQQDVTLSRARTNEASTEWENYIRGGAPPY